MSTPTSGFGRPVKATTTPTTTTPGRAGDSVFRTPNTAASGAAAGYTGRRTPGTGGAAARTPHARAARLALDHRRAAIFTPGGRKSRRKSGRYMRESPRDLLRNLSRRLAPSHDRVASSSPNAVGGGSASMENTPHGRSRLSLMSASHDDDFGHYEDDDSDSIPLDRPRMSLPIGDDDDDDNDDDLRPHRSAILDDDDNFTLRSIEMARRVATHEQLQQARRFSRSSLGGRSSLGSLQMSDYIDGFIGAAADDDGAEHIPSAFFPEGAFDHLDGQPDEDNTFERVDSESADHGLLAGRESGFGVVDVPMEGNETTFMMAADQASPSRLDSMPVFDDNGAYDDNNNSPGPWIDPEDEQDAQEEEEAAAVAEAAASTQQAWQPVAVTGAAATAAGKQTAVREKRIRMSRYGITYPSLPAGVVKRVAQTFAQSSGAGKAKLSPETVAALSTASDWFFEQVAVDLQRYSKHAGRKTIDESDVLILMKRQRQTNATSTAFSLAQRLLPRELLQELRMQPETPAGKRRPQQKRARASAAGRHEDNDEVT